MKRAKVIALLLALLLVGVMVVGCSDSTTTETAAPTAEVTAGSSATAAPAEEPTQEPLSPLTITHWVPLFLGIDVQDTPVQEAFIEKMSEILGRELTIEYTIFGWYTEYNEKLKLAINSGDLPDLVGNIGVGGSAGINGYGDQGLYVNLAAYDMPNFESLMEKCGTFVDGFYTENGDIYYVPMFNLNPYGTTDCERGITIDKTNLDYYNIPYPTTADELFEACLMFKELNPDSDVVVPGQTTGVNAIIETFRCIFRDGAGYSGGGTVHFTGTEYVVTGMSDAYREQLAYIHKYYENDLIPKDYTAWDIDMINAAKYSGTVLMWEDGAQSRVGTDPIAAETGHEYLFIDYALAVNEDGWYINRGTNTLYQASTWGALSINAQSEVAEDCVQVVEAYCSPEICNLLYYGIEGMTYNVDEEGNKVFTDEIIQADYYNADPNINPLLQYGLQRNGASPSAFFPQIFTVRDSFGVNNESNFSNYLMPDGSILVEHPRTFGETHWTYELANPDKCVDKPLPTLTSTDKEQYSEMSAALFTYIAECAPKFIDGEMSVEDDWDDYIAQCNALCDVEALLALYNDKLEGDYYND